MAELAFVSPDRGPGAPRGLLERIARAIEAEALAPLHSLQVLSPGDQDVGAALSRCDLAIFEVANDPISYRSVYELALRHPGVVVLLDTDIGKLVASLIEEGSELGQEAAGEARAAVSQVLAASEEWDRSLPLPWCARLVRHARAVVVTDPSDAEFLRRFRCRTPIHVVPGLATQREGDQVTAGEGATPDAAGNGANMEEGARRLVEAAEETIELLGDPVRQTLARWARALADCGGSVDGFRAGYGARYADALESLSTTAKASPRLPIARNLVAFVGGSRAKRRVPTFLPNRGTSGHRHA